MNPPPNPVQPRRQYRNRLSSLRTTDPKVLPPGQQALHTLLRRHATLKYVRRPSNTPNHRLELEFTNAMPAEFTYDPPWWLLPTGPDLWLERDAIEEFVALYEPRMEQFLRSLERIKCERESNGEGEQKSDGLALSARMRDLWRIGRFWFDYAAKRSFDVDMVYWAALHDDGEGAGAGVEKLDDEARADVESFIQRRMKQLEAYELECTAKIFSEM